MVVGIAGLIAATYFVAPGKSPWIAPCPFHWLTGLHCPGCGTLRGLHQLLHGNLAGAWGYNPLMVLYLPVVGYAVASVGVFAASGRKLAEPRVSPRAAWAALVIILAYGVLRNVPVYPFTLLAPH